MHPKRDVRQAIALVDPGWGASERDVVLLIRLCDERPCQITHRVRHPLLQCFGRALRNRIAVEGDIVRTAGYVDEADGRAGLDGELGGLEGSHAGAIAGHLHFDHGACRLSGGCGCGRVGRRGRLGLRRRGLLLAAAGDYRERDESRKLGEPHCRLLRKR